MRGGFWVKVAAAAGLVGLADWLFLFQRIGAMLGWFALAWTMVIALVLPATRRHPSARVCLVLAAGLALAMVEAPSLLGWALYWVALASAALLPGRAIGDAIAWGVRVFVHGCIGLFRPLRDLRRLVRLRDARLSTMIGRAVRLLALPVLGGGAFLILFASANPLIEQALNSFSFPLPDRVIVHGIFAGMVLAVVWPSLRPHGFDPQLRSVGELPALALPVATIALSLAVFNAVFAVENGLDLAFLWSGAGLPEGVTLADYVHRGAYLLIVTALLAGAFVLVLLHPGSPAAASPLVRRLLVVWIVQNLLLVASSVRRLVDYIAVYSLTELRIAAFAWMALVATGLVLVAWRMLKGRSTRWLVNANAIAAGSVLVGASLVDFGAVAAAYNVRHASAANRLDLCYLDRLGSSALVPLIELERRAQGSEFSGRVATLRARAMAEAEIADADWHGWTWRNARRLAAARAEPRRQPAAVVADYSPCRGSGD